MRLFRSSSWFTLLEIIVILSVIGILATLSFPDVYAYINRAKKIDIQIVAKNWIALMEQYRTDMGGKIPSQTQAWNPIEWFYIPNDNSTGMDIYGWEVHDGLKQYFQSRPEGQKLLVDQAKMGNMSNGGTMFYFYKLSPMRLVSWWYRFPFLNNSDNTN